MQTAFEYIARDKNGKVEMVELLKVCKEMRNGTLVLNVIHGKEVEVEYEKKEIMYEIKESIRGIREACLKLNYPVVSGNVSLYNDHR